MDYVTLNDGNKIPMLGLGVYRLSDYDTCKKAVLDALALGYRHIDTAQIYKNEAAVGDAIIESGLKREEIFLTTKIWVSNFKRVRESFNESLDRLKTPYVDMILLHQSVGPYVSAYKELEKLKEEGLAKSIGVSNFDNNQMTKLMKNTTIVPALNQIEIHPYNQREEQVEFDKANGIAVEDWYPLANAKANLLTDETIGAIAKAHGKTIPQIILRWHVQRGNIVFPRSTSIEHMKDNLDIFNFTLTDEEMATMKAINRDESYDAPHWVKNIVLRFAKA